MTRRFSPAPTVLSLALTALVFGIDMTLPLGVASAVPYTFAVLLGLADRRLWFAPFVAVLCCVLTVAKLEIVSDRGTTEEWKVIVNRCLAIFAIITTTVLGVMRRRATSAQARAEELLKSRQADLAHMGRLSMLGQITAGLAHELNQPLAAIGLHAEIAAHSAVMGEPVQTELVEALKEIGAQSARAGEIVRSVRRLARRGTPGTDPIAVDEIVASAVALLDWQARRASAVMLVNLGGPNAIVAADRVQLEQVLVNLIQNAFDAMSGQSSPVVTVAVETDARTVTVSVRDTGHGEYDPARLFEPFYTTKEGGLGLGLAISREIVQAHSGRLWAVPVASGTEFAFTLPRARNE